jgi:hypothetical protein
MGRRALCRILTSHQKSLAAATVLMAVVLSFASCGVDRTLDGTQLEADIGAQLLPQYPGAIRSISCPNSADPQPGQSVLCLATLGGQVLDVNVELGGTAEALTTTATVDARFVAVNEVAALLAATFGDEVGLVTSVDCGQPVMALDADESVPCEATDPAGITRIFDVSIDETGVVTLNLR